MNRFVRLLSVTVLVSSVVAGNATAATVQPADNQPQFTLTAEQRQQVEERWYNELVYLVESISVQFERSMPDNYQRFAEYKVKEWLPRHGKFEQVMSKASDAFANWSDPEYQKMRNYKTTLLELNIGTIHMQSYLTHGKKEDLRITRDKLQRVQKLAFPHTIEN